MGNDHILPTISSTFLVNQGIWYVTFLITEVCFLFYNTPTEKHIVISDHVGYPHKYPLLCRRDNELLK